MDFAITGILFLSFYVGALIEGWEQSQKEKKFVKESIEKLKAFNATLPEEKRFKKVLIIFPDGSEKEVEV